MNQFKSPWNYVRFINLTASGRDGESPDKYGLLHTVGCLACILFGRWATLQVSSDLQSAIDAASSGDTLEVASGLYDKITVERALPLWKWRRHRAGGRGMRRHQRNNVTISGFLVENGFYGIKLDHVRGCKISNNTVIHCAQPGIALLYSDGNIISGNNASFNGIVGGAGTHIPLQLQP